MTLHDVKQLVNELSNTEKIELRDYLDAVLVDVHQHPSDELSEREKLRLLLGDALVDIPKPEELPIDEETLLAILDDIFRGKPPLSDEIIAERQESP